MSKTVNPANRKIKNKGFTLLEVLIAIFLITVGMTGVFFLINKTLGLISTSPSKLIAIYLAQEGIEIVRNIRDTNWVEGHDWDEDLCDTPPCDWMADYNTTSLTQPYDGVSYLQNTGWIYIQPSGGGGNSIFLRKISISSSAPDTIDVTVTIYWKEKGKNYEFSIQEKLYNWH